MSRMRCCAMPRPIRTTVGLARDARWRDRDQRGRAYDTLHGRRHRSRRRPIHRTRRRRRCDIGRLPGLRQVRRRQLAGNRFRRAAPDRTAAIRGRLLARHVLLFSQAEIRPRSSVLETREAAPRPRRVRLGQRACGPTSRLAVMDVADHADFVADLDLFMKAFEAGSLDSGGGCQHATQAGAECGAKSN